MLLRLSVKKNLGWDWSNVPHFYTESSIHFRKRRMSFYFNCILLGQTQTNLKLSDHHSLFSDGSFCPYSMGVKDLNAA